MRLLYLFFFRLAGWKINGDVPRNLNKYIIIVAPHTSNWDFVIGLAVRSILRFKANFLGKAELFKAPFGWFFRRWGGFPVDRSKANQLVEQVVSICEKEAHFALAIAPEGTRKNTGRWKTGFYHIAHQAGIPIVMAGIDYSTKTVSFAAPFMPSGNFESDLPHLLHFYADKKGKTRGIGPII